MTLSPKQSMGLLVSLCVLLYGLTASLHIIFSDSPASDDNQLIRSVQAAVKQELAPDQVEEAIGRAATLNTIREPDQDIFFNSRLEIVPDPDRKAALINRGASLWAAYWVRPVKSHNPKIVGITWPRDGGKSHIFFGEILPPE